MANCEAITKRRVRCPIEDATYHPVTGKWYCHAHNPDALFQKQLAAKRAEPKRRRRR